MKKFFIILLLFLNMSFCFAEDKTNKIYIDVALKFIIDFDGEKIYFPETFNFRDEEGFIIKEVILGDHSK